MKEESMEETYQGLSRTQEEQKLEEIIEVAQDNLERTEHYIRGLSDNLADILETYDTKDKEALALWHNAESQLNENRMNLLRCKKARKKPYFGWISFHDANQPEAESYYVGRVGIAKNGSDPVVIDWRAPIASIYYENAMGRCKYVVKNDGTYEVDLKHKRTYEIANDKLVDFFDSDVVATDELLTKYLAKSKKAVLGEIIATIQKEQNEIIRKSPRTNLIVQGVAGSGKTTVAMHRISYILYNYEEFRPEDFYIIGSNRILLNYITGVLPDLDVYGVSQMTMEQLFTRLLYEDWNPLTHKIVALDRKDPYAYIKGSCEWFHDLETFCEAYENSMIPREEIRLEKNGALLIGPVVIGTYLENNPGLSMQSKINMLNEILLSKLENELLGKHVSFTAVEKKELEKKYSIYFGKDVWRDSVFELYKDFLQEQSSRGKTIHFRENEFDVYDLAALAFLYKRIKETDGVREASHVIIDEAQDFGMMAYGALHYCLRDCTYTIMGDVSQNIHYGYGLNDWEELRQLILTGIFDSFGLLKKSYRNTVEISNFATEILRHGNFAIYPVEPIVRHGNDVVVAECKDEQTMVARSAELIRGWQREGHETVAVICRDEKEAAWVSGELGKQIPLADSNLETAEFGSGVIVLPVEYTKGLEFDAVLLFNPSEENYPAEDQYVKLLYVAATRALHELAIVHAGDLTELIARPVSMEKRMQSLEHEMQPKAKQFEKKEFTTKELQEQAVIAGHKEKAKRGYIGPKPIVVPKPAKEPKPAIRLKKIAASRNAAEPKNTTASKNAVVPKSVATAKNATASLPLTTSNSVDITKQIKLKNTNETNILKTSAKSELPINESMHQFGEMVTDSSMLRPKGHGRIDNSIRWIKKTKNHVDLVSGYGIMRLTPVEDSLIRIQFIKSQSPDFKTVFWEKTQKAGTKWSAKESKSLVQIETAKLVIRIEKKSGALQFMDRKGKLLLAERSELPRQVEPEGNKFVTWNYFEWEKSEKLSAKGILDDSLERMNQKARYISFGGKQMRMPLVVSEKGYGIGVAAEASVMCCDIPIYKPYIYTEGVNQIDYYFLYGSDYSQIVELYRTVHTQA